LIAPLALEQAQTRLMALAPRFPAVHIPAQSALGRYQAGKTAAGGHASGCRTRAGGDWPAGQSGVEFVTAVLFALPLVRAMMGADRPLPLPERMLAGEALPATGPRREFLRAVRDNGAVRLAGSQDSSALAALAQADCLIDRPANAPALSAGEPVPVFNLQNG